MNDTLQKLMRDATALTRDGRLFEATAAIQHALGVAESPMAQAFARVDIPARGAVKDPHERDAGDSQRPRDTTVLDGCVREVAGSPATVHPTARTASTVGIGAPSAAAEVRTDAAMRPEVDPSSAQTGRHSTPPNDPRPGFSSGTHTHAGLTRGYKLYVPARAATHPTAGTGRPLVVMLHGCTQDPDDFAAGTGMNALADESGFCVLYPAQAADANPQRCWNWFKHNHQQKGRGEPGLIASVTQQIMAENGIDPRRVHIAGLSAGGAMAAIVGALYPEIFASIGVHSGLAAGAASNLPEALAAMQGGGAAHGSAFGAAPGLSASLTGFGGHPLPGLRAVNRATSTPMAPLRVPVIVFHGDNDSTVHPRNGEQVIASVRPVGAAPTAAAAAAVVTHGTSAFGRRYTRSVHAGDADLPDREHWSLHGAGHAWSGGQRAGSYTDASGPSASCEMLRFFEQHPLDVIRAETT